MSSDEIRAAFFESAIEPLRHEALFTPTGGSRFAAIGADAIETLDELMDDEYVVVRWHAALLLRELGGHQEQVARRLLPRLTDPHTLFRLHVRWVLRQLRPASVEVLREGLRGSTPRLRAAVIDALAFIGPDAAAAVPDLEALRGDAEVGEAAVAALREIVGPWPENPSRPVPYLGELITFDELPAEHVIHGPDDVDDAHVWTEMANEVAQLNAERLDIFAEWPAEAERTYAEGLRRWRPASVVLARPEARLTFYDWRADAMAPGAVVRSDDPRGFGMLELLWKAIQLYERDADGRSRKLEGITASEEEGVFMIQSGS